MLTFGSRFSKSPIQCHTDRNKNNIVYNLFLWLTKQLATTKARSILLIWLIYGGKKGKLTEINECCWNKIQLYLESWLIPFNCKLMFLLSLFYGVFTMSQAFVSFGVGTWTSIGPRHLCPSFLSSSQWLISGTAKLFALLILCSIFFSLLFSHLLFYSKDCVVSHSLTPASHTHSAMSDEFFVPPWYDALWQYSIITCRHDRTSNNSCTLLRLISLCWGECDIILSP